MIRLPLNQQLDRTISVSVTDDERFRFRTRWMERPEVWQMDIYTEQGEPLLLGLVLRSDTHIRRQHHVPSFRYVVMPVDTSGRSLDPGRRDLGARVQVYVGTFDEFIAMTGA